MSPAEQTRQFSTSLNELLQTIRERAMAQFAYNLETNVPREIISINDCAEHAITHGLVSAIARREQWCTIGTMRFCGDLLEDVNCHREAALIRDLAAKEEATP